MTAAALMPSVLNQRLARQKNLADTAALARSLAVAGTPFLFSAAHAVQLLRQMQRPDRAALLSRHARAVATGQTQRLVIPHRVIDGRARYLWDDLVCWASAPMPA